MTQHRDLDPFTAEQLLSGAPVDGEVGPLADLLAAAAAPARADELTGEAAAVAAFRDAAGVSRPATATAARTAVGRALGLKVAVAVAAVAGAGVAGAAVSGILPGGNDASAPISAPSTSATKPAPSVSHTDGGSTAPPSGNERGNTTGPITKTPTPPPPSKTKSPHKTPSARPTVEPSSFYEQCVTYLAYYNWDQYDRYDDARDEGNPYGPYQGRPSTSPDDRRTDNRRSDALLEQKEYRPLVKAAGGKANVRSYCMRLLYNSRGERAPEGAKPSTKQSVRPSGRPTTDPTSRPAASQTGKASAALPPPRGR